MVSNKVRTYSLGIQNVVNVFLSLGHELIWAANFSDYIGNKEEDIPCKTVHIDIYAYPFHRTNIRAYKQIKKLINEHNIEVVQCMTPIGSTLARIAAWRCGVKNVIYTAHGFLFFKSAPLINRIVYKIPELLLARVTDTLITICEEDYNAAMQFKLRSGTHPYLIHGAGVNIGVRVNTDRLEIRNRIGLGLSDIVVVSAGDLNPNKNNRVVIEAMSKIPDSRIHYVICGTGILEDELKEMSKSLGVENRVHFLGYRTDMPEILACSDIFVMPSYREGVPRAILEAMDLGLPCIGSKTRGIADLIDENKGGYICRPNDSRGFANAIVALANDSELRHSFGQYNREKAKGYSIEIVREELTSIYKKVI